MGWREMQARLELKRVQREIPYKNNSATPRTEMKSAMERGDFSCHAVVMSATQRK